MEWEALETHFSLARTRRYLNEFDGDPRRAALAYEQNMFLAQALVPMLHAIEIALRNAVHVRLTASLGRADWWEKLPPEEFSRSLREIHAARAKLVRRNEPVTPDKIVAELSFGFWTSLFNVNHQQSLWGDLRLAFPHCPKATRQRKVLSNALNSVRNLRNRVFHHEPLLWMSPQNVDQCHTRGKDALGWLDPRLVAWLDRHDDVKQRWKACTEI